ncbi:E3 binding domain-containing protein [Planococcus sp. CP5-4]|uniref:biotin/lipoyl-containing protein n=1 Tax=unclassified Planococcus (in: firmicutes) TaxID=2662419 RepID=UPI001C22D507|nr:MULTISPECIES: biotin/lipoyl-containing protein [unclassified Planococcus (in: firmicutes)]MBU9674729.1 E3 binding domain-containing protein [Planococcus sp. CP5-4_YE]MBV0910350.1 E3 binding domain-containing protein [Planococcus sp. CP5-4_UN]MBW6063874.1 E3 binding domain-containing protein [Planococcus sp. CP5-4]
MHDVTLPKLSEDTDKSLIVLWFVDEGDYVEEGAVLCEVQTEKAVSEIRAETSGTVKKIHVKRGDSVKASTLLAVIDPKGKAASNIGTAEKVHLEQAEENEASQETASFTRVSPRLRHLAKELSVKLEDIKGTGKGGAITEQDIRDESGL